MGYEIFYIIMAQPKPPLLEYWKPPKPVRHFRSASGPLSLAPPKREVPKTIYSPSVYSSYPTSVYPDEKHLSDEKHRSGVSISSVEMAKEYNNMVVESPTASGPKSWGKKVWIGIGAAIVIVIIAIVVPVVVVTRNNRYPDYTKLTYTLSETCTYCLVHLSLPN